MALSVVGPALPQPRYRAQDYLGGGDEVRLPLSPACAGAVGDRSGWRQTAAVPCERAACTPTGSKDIHAIEDQLLRAAEIIVVHEGEFVDERDHARERYGDRFGCRWRGADRIRVPGGDHAGGGEAVRHRRRAARGHPTMRICGRAAFSRPAMPERTRRAA